MISKIRELYWRYVVWNYLRLNWYFDEKYNMICEFVEKELKKIYKKR